MQLHSMSINLQDWGDKKGQYVGTVLFKGSYGSVEVALHPALSKKVLALCAEMLVEQAKEAGKLIAGDVLEQAPQIEHKR